MSENLHEILKAVQDGTLSVADAELRLKKAPFEDLGYAKVDFHRSLRQGAAEVIYGAGKTPAQILGIAETMRKNGVDPILITRISAEAAQLIGQSLPLDYRPEARLGIVGSIPTPATGRPKGGGAAGRSDDAVPEEAAVTAEVHGSRVIRLYDVGVAGLHRLLAHLDELMQARVVIAVAGMEGALASVVGGLVSCPVIAVPTSVGYGASFGGVSALLSMLNSCASGVSVVNIDNGFGAGFLASRINHMGGCE